MRVTIVNKTQKHPELNSWLNKISVQVLLKLSKTRTPGAKFLNRSELSIALVSSKVIQKINREWRKKNYVTDVLSFPQLTKNELLNLNDETLKESDTWLIGDVVICLERAEEQAREKGHTFRFELQWLLIHGILHLLGYDHEISSKEAQRMRRIEKRLLTR